MYRQKLIASFFLILIISAIVNARPQNLDLIERDVEERQADPGWVRRQLMRVGNAASSVSGAMGGYAVRLTNVIEKICSLIKKVIPIVGAVCTVGQFKFCALDNTTGGDGMQVGGFEGDSMHIAGPGISGRSLTGTGIVNLDEQD